MKFGGKLYSDVDGSIDLEDVWVVCGPSLRRIKVRDKNGDYVEADAIVIEEIEQTLGLLHSAPIMQHRGKDIRGRTYLRLARLCRSCIEGGGQVIALDAHGSARAVRDLHRLCNVQQVTVVEAPEGSRTLWTGMVEHRYSHPADLLQAILSAADNPDHKGYVYVNAKSDLLALELLLKGKGRSVLTIHGDSPPRL